MWEWRNEQGNQLRHIVERNEQTGSCTPGRRNYITDFLGIFFTNEICRT